MAMMLTVLNTYYNDMEFIYITLFRFCTPKHSITYPIHKDTTTNFNLTFDIAPTDPDLPICIKINRHYPNLSRHFHKVTALMSH